MSLLKRLLISITVVITCILVGTLVFSIDGARHYLNGQLQSQSDNAASSLALSLSQPANQDKTVRDLLMMALYDSGQFQSIRLVSPEGTGLFERVMPASGHSGEAPDWFSRLLPLTSPVALRDVSDGWRQVGQLSVVASDVYARDALWRSSLRVFMLVLTAGLLWALFAVLLIRWFKRALMQEVSDPVRAIGGDKQAPPVRRGVAELEGVSRVITAVHERVLASSHEQNSRIESLQIEVNRDPVTGLANRRYFLNELRRALSADHSASYVGGHVLIFRQRDLAAINHVMTHSGVDQWLASTGQRVALSLQSAGAPAPQLARLNGSDFVVLMAGMKGPEATRLAQRIRQDLEAMRVSIQGGRLCRWAMALTDYTPECDMTMVLSRLDHGLMCAESAGHGDVEYIAYGHDIGSGGGKGATEAQWRTVLFDALADDRLELAVNYTVHVNRHSRPGTDNEIVSYEASLMMREGETLLSGYLFMPAAVRLGLSAQCDLRAISLGLQWIAQHSGYLVIKVSLPSLIQTSFLHDMQRMLAAQPDYAARLILEIDAHGLLAYRAEVLAFCEKTVALDVRVGVRRLAQQTGALMYLHRAPLSYVKLGGDFITDLLASPGSQQLLTAITQTANDLGIAVYAEDVPDEDTARLLHQQGACTLSVSEPYGAPVPPAAPSHPAP